MIIHAIITQPCLSRIQNLHTIHVPVRPYVVSVNYARCYWACGFNSTVTLIPSFQISDCCTCATVPCHVVCLTYTFLQVHQKSGHFCFAAVPDPQSPFLHLHNASIKCGQTFFKHDNRL